MSGLSVINKLHDEENRPKKPKAKFLKSEDASEKKTSERLRSKSTKSILCKNAKPICVSKAKNKHSQKCLSELDQIRALK